ncbi:unnamed protein product, partial [Rotaria sp. Silwood1]
GSQKKDAKKQSPARRLKLFEIYKFADKLDVLFMFIGTIACMGTGAVFPLMMLVYRNVATSLVKASIPSVLPNLTSIIDINATCAVKPENSTADVLSELRGMIKWYGILGCASILCYWIGFSLWMIAAERQVRRIRFALFRSIMNQEMGWFDKLNPGELNKLRDGLGDKKAEFISLICRLIGGLVFAFVTGWKLALVFISLSPLTVIAFNITMRVIAKYTAKEIKAFSKASAVAQEVLGSIRTVTAFGGQKKEEQRFSENLLEAKQIGIKKGLYMGLCQAAAQVAIYISFAITFWYNTSERVVQDALDKAKAGRTTIVIAHRLSTIRNADLIIGLERGCVVESGTYDDLMEYKGLYYELVTAQMQKEKEKEVDPDIDKEDDEVEREFVRERSFHKIHSKQSIASNDDFDENDKEDDKTASDAQKKKKKRSRTPFVFQIFKLNAPEWPWILMGAVFSLIFGAIQPIFALFFAQIYGLFGEPDLKKQEHLTSVYAGLIFLIGFVGGVAQFLSNLGFAKSGEELTLRMRKLTFSAIIRQEIGYFDYETNSVGALVTRLSSDAAALKVTIFNKDN